MKYTKEKCGCCIVEDHLGGVAIRYCPKHKAVDDLYEACKEVAKAYKCSPTSMQPLFWLRCVQALAKVTK